MPWLPVPSIVVSSDAHLLNLKHYQNTPIVDPAEALLRIAQGSGR